MRTPGEFDSVSRDGLLRIMAKFGCPLNFISLVRQLCDDILARVKMLESSLNRFGGEWSKARLCAGLNPIQHDVFFRAFGCILEL